MIQNRNIQILRGLAVIGVISYHSFPKFFKNGYFGVDLFFIISGFVIAPLLEEIKSEKLTLMDFLKRRFWRLAPALICTLIIFVPVLTILANIANLRNIYIQSLFSLLMSSNISAYKFIGDYFNQYQNPLIHTWSLSVEQQIYLFTPFVILLMKRVKKNLKLEYLYIALGIISLLLSYKINVFNQTMNFYSPIYRFSQFSIGALIYYWSKNRSQNKSVFLKINPFFLIILIFFLFSFGPNNFNYITIILVIFNKLIFTIPFPCNRVSQHLTLIGNRSYSLYLVHWPILWLVKNSPMLDFIGLKKENPVMVAFGLILTWISGSFLNKNIENKYRNPKEFRFLLLTPLLVLVCMIIAAISLSDKEFYLKQTVLNRPTNQMDPGFTACEIMTSKNICNHSTGGPKKFLIIGDSHAGSITKTIVDIATPFGAVDSFLHAGCQYISLKYVTEKEFKSGSKSCFAYSRQVEKVVNQGNYDLIIASYRSSSLNPLVNGNWKTYAKFKVKSILELANVYMTETLLLGPTPEFPTKPSFFDAQRLLIEGNENLTRNISIKNMNTVPFLENTFLKKIDRTRPIKFKYIDLIDNFCDSKVCSRWDNDWLYSDSDHLSALGATKISLDLRDYFLSNN